MCMAEMLCSAPEIMTTLLIGDTPIYNKKFCFFLFKAEEIASLERV